MADFFHGLFGRVVDIFDGALNLVPAMPEALDPGLPFWSWVVLAVSSAAIGACIGSFLNVCIYRIPLDQSIVRPGSHCMSCGSPIRWYYNIPVLSYFMLRGKCAKCGAPFSCRYAAVEFLVAMLFLAVFCMWPSYDSTVPPLGMRLLPLARGAHGSIPYPPWAVLAYWVFLSGLVVGTFVDFDHFIIPDSVTKGGVVAGLVLSTLVPTLQTQLAVVPDSISAAPRLLAVMPATRGGALFRSLLGAAIGYAIVQLVRKGGTWWMRHRGRIGKDDEAMGYGDVKLAAAIGAFLGWQGALFSLVAGSVGGSIIALPSLLFRRKGAAPARIPFGPWLSLGAAIWLFWGHRLVAAYFTMTPPWRIDIFQ